MSVDCAHVEADWELFALGSLDEAAQQAMAAHLQSGCKECQRRFLEAHVAVVSVAGTAPARQPSGRVERVLMKRIRAEQRLPSPWPWLRWNPVPWAIATACVVLAGWFFLQQRKLDAQLASANSVIQSLHQAGSATAVPVPKLPPVAETPSSPLPVHPTTASSLGAPPADNQKLAAVAAEVAKLKEENAAISAARAAAEQRSADLQASLDAAQARGDGLSRDLEAAKRASRTANQPEIADLNRQLSDSRAEVQRLIQDKARAAQIEAVLQSGSMQQVELRPVDPAAGKAFARVLYSPRGGLLLVAASLPKLEHEKCYQLWLIRKGAPAILSAGLLQTSDDGRGFLFAPPTNELAQLTGLAITDEPKGGSVPARGHKLLFGAR
jgi:anti-sigma-K factor RskA